LDQLTNDLLIQVWNYAALRFAVYVDWIAEETKEYLRIFCINQDSHGKFVDGCRRYMEYEEYNKDPGQSKEAFS
jgi:hypothetical protein